MDAEEASMRAETAKTHRFEDAWLAPVDTVHDLPVLAAEGQLCFVKSEDRVYVYTERRWTAAR
jgi:hypothetical protein